MVARQLLKPRVGSIAEDEVAALIRRLAFLNRPLTPDDIGADFVCVVAEERLEGQVGKKPVPMLYAGSWFLLSVKSGKAKVGLEKDSGHFEWFVNLDLPYFIAQVESEDELRVSIYHSLQHIAAIKNLPTNVQSVEFRCETSPHYKPRNYRMDHLDVIEISNSKAIAWLGPPLLEISRPQLLNQDFVEIASKLLQLVCNFHPSIRMRGRAGMNTGVMWETNKSIETPVKGYNVPALVKSTAEAVTEIEQILEMCQGTNNILEKVYFSSQPLFNFYKAMKRADEQGRDTITEDEVFNNKKE